MKTALLMLLAFACLPYAPRCLASDRIVADVYTHHSAPCQEFASTACTPWQQPHRISWQHDVTDTALATDIGIGTNSFGKLSVNVGVMWHPISLGPAKLGVFSALVSGYTCEQLKTCFVVGGLEASATFDRIALQILYAPSVSNKTVSVLQLRAGLTF